MTANIQSSENEYYNNALSLSFSDSDKWHISADEPWWALVDIRDMLNLFHPFVVPETGKSAGAWQEVTIPDEWKPPFALRFYCADDYFADPENHKPGQLGTESFFEHRFKQVLIDDKVIWERDVSDENIHSSQTIFQVDITPFVKPGKPFRLAFRVLDKVSTLERNKRDVWFIGGVWYAAGDGETEEPPRFHTAVWFADPVIGERNSVETFPPGRRPHEKVVAEYHKSRLPLLPQGQKMPSPVSLKLVSPAPIPEYGFPITCGIPMPPGALTDVNSIRLLNGADKEIPVQAKVTGLWQDGSIRWILLNAIAPSGTEGGDGFYLHLGEGAGRKPDIPIRIEQDGQQITVDTGAINIRLWTNRKMLLDAIFRPGQQKPIITDLRPQMSILAQDKPTPVNATCQKIEIEEDGPVVACIEIHGSLDTEDQHVGRFLFRLYAYAGLPTIQIHFRIFNDVKPEIYNGNMDDLPLDVTELTLAASAPGKLEKAALGVVDGEPIVSGSGILSVLQEDAEHFAAFSDDSTQIDGRRAQGWVAASGANGTIQASVWRFWQQYPKSLKVNGDALQIGLFTASKEMPVYKPRFGEAKRHDLWFTFTDKPTDDETRIALGLLANEPPRLFSRKWFCLSGGISLMDPDFYENEPALRNYTNRYGDVSTEQVTRHFGIRNFGDMPYGSSGQWRNGYWAMIQGALNWGLALGDQRWLERSFEMARHIADVDTVHILPEHPDWNEWHGVICAIGNDHSVHGGHAKWPAFQVGESLVLHYWMTGDPDSLDAAASNADYLIRSGAGLGSTEARSQARPMLTLLRVWQATGQEEYRQAANRYMDLKFQAEKVIDWRRGAYIQPTYNNWRCISAGLNSMYGINVYEYYRLTGDLDAAQLVVAIADSVYAESMLPQEEGLGSFIFYVRYSRSSWYYTQMALLFHIAYDLTEDIRFLRAGRAAFQRYRLCRNANGDPMYQPYDNFGWLDPEFGGWQMEFRDIVTEPFHITGQTPIPDPAAYQVEK